MNSAPRIRQAGVAGLFYPRDPARLVTTVDELLSEVRPRRHDRHVCGLLAPHAGYLYSGTTAAAAFTYLDDEPVTTVIIIGPSHVETFAFTSVFMGEAYDTPLGRVCVNMPMAAALADANDTIELSPRGHHQPHLTRSEHAVEVELPFLQRVRADTTIVPIIMGNQGWDQCLALGDAIARVCDASTVIVASSDLSHFHSDARARELDAEFCRVLQTLDARALHDAVRAGRAEACGIGPVSAMLLATDATPDRHCDVLEQTNSGAVTRDRSSVVGYAAAVLSVPRRMS